MAHRILIAGLGNLPFPTTYHSIGQLALTELAQRHRLEWHTSSGVSFTQLNDDVHLVYSHQLMNVSGKTLARHYDRIQAGRLLVLHDDLQREWGKVSIKHGGSANGHNGLKSLSKHLKQGLEFDRLRIGIGRPTDKKDVADYVLSKLSPAQLDDITNGSLYTHIEHELNKYVAAQ
ncbi:hypothetical protein E3P99_01039 [Wallemia hederae]|uniref:peptidyl-tRNA hydrolase n=1 Tax=Wallemia hederae TaxID=1540922 RepID=A0A4T0FSF0_9BASI|nr:hypothetical protein E3P99_01039 [Wallemia hederae]